MMSKLLSQLDSGDRLVIGMVQLPALPGGANYRGERFDDILEVALSEASILIENGIDSLLVQNLGDIPVASRVTTVQVAWMTRITAEIVRMANCSVGINLLENDAEAMFAAASASGADYVRIKVYVGTMLTPFGLETGQAHTAIRARTQWKVDRIAIFADVHDRTGVPLQTGGFDEDVEFALRLGLADGLVLTGKTYEQTLELIDRARRQYPKARILAGGGVTASNFAEVVSRANGAIVSTSMKGSSSAVGRFVPEKVKEFMAAARKVQTA